ncbi:hypothetical protein HCJ93_24325 [Streptomyces sp. SBST2-5]|uniref:Uncharacterized protein n=1 Tax=Streptomyces composti TaxID=2720025 RepID=A0ABX1ADX1_9ACTN|nr:hypothetical protein [Streptomyces composti]NJP53107.1 hypothetical protein [Streptomyces composti]
MPRHAGARARTLRNTRLLALAGVVLAGAVVLPLAIATAGPGGSGTTTDMKRAAERHATAGGAGRAAGTDPEEAAPPSAGDEDGTPASDAAGEGGGEGNGRGSGAPVTPGGIHLSTAVRCGPELTSPEGIEAQTCVVARGEDVWARTYYRNATGGALHAVLALLGPGGRSVRMPCAADAGDEPAICETPRGRIREDLAGYSAVAEFSRSEGRGPLLLRSGSNSQS